MNTIDKAVDLCENLQGFFVMHAVGGGCGSGGGAVDRAVKTFGLQMQTDEEDKRSRSNGNRSGGTNNNHD